MQLLINEYSTLGYAYVQEFLTPKETEFLAQNMLDAKKENRLKKESDVRYYNNSVGGRCPGLLELLQEKTPLMKELLNKNNIVPESVYARFYHNESTLNPHFDRPGLDHTLSVTLFTNLDTSWPLYCLDKNCNMQSFDIKLGDGALILGTKLVHWRKPLICSAEQYTIQAFFHWKDV